MSGADSQELKQNQGPIYRFLVEDHDRLGSLLDRTIARTDQIDRAAYAKFRSRLLKHIAMEEKVLLPAAQRLRGAEPLAIASKLRLDHGALAALLVPTPTHAIVAAIRAILEIHNEVEEGPEGLYELSDQLLGSEADAIITQFKSAHEVKVAPHVDGPHVMEAARRAITRAGHDLKI